MNEEEEMAGEISRWTALSGHIKTLVISKLDNKSRRALRACSLDSFYHVAQFFTLDCNNIHYFTLTKVEDPNDNEPYKLSHRIDNNRPFYELLMCQFATVEEMVDSLQNITKNVNTFKSLSYKIEGFSTPIDLMKNRRQIKAETIGLEISCDPHVATDIVLQFDMSFANKVILEVHNIPDEAYKFLTIENLCVFNGAVLNDGAVLNLKAERVTGFANSVTIRAFKQFLKKMLRGAETKQFFFLNVSEEFRDVFNDLGRIGMHTFHINPTHWDSALKLQFLQDSEELQSIQGELIRKDPNFWAEQWHLDDNIEDFVQSIEQNF